MGRTTLEYDVATISTYNFEESRATLQELAPSRTVKERVDALSLNNLEPDCLESAIRAVGGKGRFAHRLSQRTLDPPQYIVDALRFISDP